MNLETFFIPYVHGNPLAVDIKGHRLLLVGTDPELMNDQLEFIGGDTLRELKLPEGDRDQLAEIAASVRGGVVVAPEGMTLGDLLDDLETELPWVH